MSPPVLNEIVYALSQLGFRKESGPPKQPAMHGDTKTQLRVLYLLSRLLVWEAYGDFIAISIMRTEANDIELWISRRCRCTTEELTYIKTLFSIALDPMYPPENKCIDLFELIVAQCNNKIVVLLEKISEQLRGLLKSDNFILRPVKRGIDGTSCVQVLQCEEDIRAIVGHAAFPADSSLNHFLNKWFRHLIANVTPEAKLDWPSKDGLFFQAINIAYYLIRVPQTAFAFDPTLYKRFGKLACYRTAIEAFLFETERWDSYGSFVVKEIITPTPSWTPPPDNFLHTLNRWAQYKGTSPVSLSNVLEAYPRTNTTSRTIDTSELIAVPTVHCACYLALRLAKHHFHSPVHKVFHMAVSKSMCWLCHVFIEALQKTYPHITIHVSPYHKGPTSGWALPPNTPSGIAQIVHQQVHEALDEVLVHSTPATQETDSYRVQLPDSWKEALRQNMIGRQNGLL